MFVVAVFAILVSPVVKPAFVADCHLTIVPVFPLSVNVVEFVPVQTVAPPAMLPPTDAGETVIVPLDENVESHTPDLITAL